MKELCIIYSDVEFEVVVRNRHVFVQRQQGRDIALNSLQYAGRNCVIRIVSTYDSRHERGKHLYFFLSFYLSCRNGKVVKEIVVPFGGIHLQAVQTDFSVHVVDRLPGKVCCHVQGNVRIFVFVGQMQVIRSEIL